VPDGELMMSYFVAQGRDIDIAYLSQAQAQFM
jgi:hypothetical protein